MLKQESQAAYLSAAAAGTTQIGLHIIVYEALARELLRCGEAVRKRDIAARCSASNRAILLLGHLEAWAEGLDDSSLVASLKTFYQGLRGDIVRLQTTSNPPDFDRLSETVFNVRGSWQTKEQRALNDQVSLPAPVHTPPAYEPEAYASSAQMGWCA